MELKERGIGEKKRKKGRRTLPYRISLRSATPRKEAWKGESGKETKRSFYVDRDGKRQGYGPSLEKENALNLRGREGETRQN